MQGENYSVTGKKKKTIKEKIIKEDEFKYQTIPPDDGHFFTCHANNAQSRNTSQKRTWSKNVKA
jgi:hypothetical protein